MVRSLRRTDIPPAEAAGVQAALPAADRMLVGVAVPVLVVRAVRVEAAVTAPAEEEDLREAVTAPVAGEHIREAAAPAEVVAAVGVVAEPQAQAVAAAGLGSPI